MTLFGTIRKKILSKNIEKRNLEYLQVMEDKQRLFFQLGKFNKCWQKIIKNIQYYSDLVNDKKLPKRFETWKEFLEKVPVITKKTIQESKNIMFDKSRNIDFVRTTGGTTSQPIQLPAWNSEMRITELDMWFARSWYGIYPNSKLFLIWGHSHLLGAGIKGKINKFKRKFKDYLLGYYRFSAYNMNEENMRRAALEMLDFHPDYIIGYSVVLDSFVRANRDLITELRKIGVKVVIGAAESFPSDNTEEILGKMFNCPVGMEYGSVETNLIAHTHPDGGYKVFWQNYFVEAIDNGLQNGKIIRVTSLYPRCFPLIRYEIGDAAQLFEGDNGIGLTRFQKVIGRCNLSVNLKDGSIIHSEVFTHALRDCEGIIRYQVIQNKDSIRLLIIKNEKFNNNMEIRIKEKFSKIHPDLNKVKIEVVQNLEQTLAGKTPMIIRHTV